MISRGVNRAVIAANVSSSGVASRTTWVVNRITRRPSSPSTAASRSPRSIASSCSCVPPTASVIAACWTHSYSAPGRHCRDAHDCQLAEEVVDLVAVEQRPAEPHPRRERSLGVGDHAEDAKAGRSAQHGGDVRLGVVGVEVWEPSHRAVTL